MHLAVGSQSAYVAAESAESCGPMYQVLCLIRGFQRRTHGLFELCAEVLAHEHLDASLRIALRVQQPSACGLDKVCRSGGILAEVDGQDAWWTGRAWALLGQLHLWNFERAPCEEMLTKALRSAQQADDRSTESFVWMMKGILRRLEGEHKAALTDLHRALIVSEAHQALRHPDILSQLGRTHFQMGQIRDSLAQFEDIVHRFGVAQCAASIHESIATLHVILGHTNRAEQATLRMIELAEKRGNPKELCTMRARLAGPYMMKGHYTQALALLEACLTEASGLGVVSDWMLIMVYDRANVMVEMKHPEALTVATAAYHQCGNARIRCKQIVRLRWLGHTERRANERSNPMGKASISGAKRCLRGFGQRSSWVITLRFASVGGCTKVQRFGAAHPRAMGATPQPLSLAGQRSRYC